MASSSPSVSSVVLNQFDAAIQLVQTMAPSLTSLELMVVRQGLVRSYAALGIILNQRDDVLALAHKFGCC